jgi:hypothetical protein
MVRDISLENHVLIVLKKNSQKVAGAAGFEPAHVGTKNRCLTAWPRPKIQDYINHIFMLNARGSVHCLHLLKRP